MTKEIKEERPVLKASFSYSKAAFAYPLLAETSEYFLHNAYSTRKNLKTFLKENIHRLTLLFFPHTTL